MIYLRKKESFMSQKILIVEDSELYSKFYFIILNNYPKCELFFTANRIETLNLFDLQKDMELIISDINMPIM
jgi:CheY-like chemotaxis protein